jgi:PhnB protein
MQIQPHLCFEGRCEEAIEFYRKALGAEVTFLIRFSEAPPCPGGMPADTANKVMHASLRIGDSTVLMSDGNCRGPAKFDGIQMAIQLPTEDTADRLFAALADGGRVQMPLGKTFWSPAFGMVADRFGVTWMVNAAGGQG